MWINIDNIEQAQDTIANSALVFLYIGQKNCSVCHSLKPQVERLLNPYPDIKLLEIDALELPEVASTYHVLTVPVMLFFVEGREYLRKARMVNTQQLAEELQKIIERYQQSEIEPENDRGQN